MNKSIPAIFLILAALSSTTKADGVFVRFKLTNSQDATYFVRVGGYIHKVPPRL